MNGVLVVLIAAVATWMLLRAIRDVHGHRRLPPVWEQDHRRRQLDREVRESHPIRWRR